MDGFFKIYLENYDTGLSSQQQTPQQVVDCDDDNDFFGNYLSSRGVNSRMVETELESYLNEPPIKYSKNFDILSWWKLNGLRYPMVAQMAKDLLGIQISTVASDSTFSTGRRVITDYRSNLSVGIVEALICTADWTRKSRMPIMDNVDDILNDDDVAIKLEEAIHNNKTMGKRPRMNYLFETIIYKRGRLKGMAQKSQPSLKQKGPKNSEKRNEKEHQQTAEKRNEKELQQTAEKRNEKT
ncbi:hypothetical protein LXL04_029636 [Taraxacum kok-saghyz]